MASLVDDLLELSRLESGAQPPSLEPLDCAAVVADVVTSFAKIAARKSISLDAEYAAPYLNLGILHDLYLWDGKRALELYGRYLVLSPGGDSTVVKWVADLKNRKPQHAMLTVKEKE